MHNQTKQLQDKIKSCYTQHKMYTHTHTHNTHHESFNEIFLNNFLFLFFIVKTKKKTPTTKTKNQLFGQGKENEYDDDITVVRGPPGPPGIDGNLFNLLTHSFTHSLSHSST